MIGLDGEAVEFEWNIFPDKMLELLHEIQRKMAENRIRPKVFKDRIIFMSMYNDIDWTTDGHLEKCVSNFIEVKTYANRFWKGHWSFLGPGTRETWYGTHTFKPNGLWNQCSEMIMLHLRERGHLVFRATSALDRGSLKSKKGGKLSIPYNGALSTAELSFRTVISVNDLSVHGAISDRCEETGSAILTLFVFQHGETCGEYE